ncbi:PilZ domain-containing protein [Nannocystaceae bacterium ST9]
MDERRAHERFQVDLRARVVLPDGIAIPAQTIDISFSGICVHAHQRVEPRTRVRFQVWLVLPERETSELLLPAKIVWSTPIEGVHQLGGAFDRDMDNYAWTRLDVLLQFLAGELDRPERL